MVLAENYSAKPIDFNASGDIEIPDFLVFAAPNFFISCPSTQTSTAPTLPKVAF